MNDMCKLASTGLELPQAMASHRVVPTRFKFKIAPVSERPLPMVATKLRRSEVRWRAQHVRRSEQQKYKRDQLSRGTKLAHKRVDRAQ